MPSRANETPPKTLLFPIALALLTLPTTLPLIFAYVLSQATLRSSRRAERQFMNELGKLAVRMLLPSIILSAPPSP